MFDHRYLDEGVEEIGCDNMVFLNDNDIDDDDGDADDALEMIPICQSFQINQFKNDLKSHSSSRESSSDENPEGDMLSGGYG